MTELRGERFMPSSLLPLDVLPATRRTPNTNRASGFEYCRRMLLAAVAVAAVVLLPGGHTTVAVAQEGNLDPTFGTDGRVITNFNSRYLDSTAALVLQPDGRIVAAGDFDGDFGVVRYLSDGSLDNTFGVGGIVTTGFGGGVFAQLDRATSLVLQPDGKLVAAGQALGGSSGSDFGLVRYMPDGSLDQTFGAGGRVTSDFGSPFEFVFALQLQPDGRLVALGGPPLVLARYNPDGSLDATFGAGGKVTIDSADLTLDGGLLLQPDGRLVAAGGSGGDFFLVRFHSNGSLDETFGVGGRVTTDFGQTAAVFDLVLQPDGKLVAVGGRPLAASTGVEDFVLARYHADGALDDTFGMGGRVATDFSWGSFDRAHAALLQPDGRLVVAGLVASPTITPRFGLARYHADGSLDETF